MDGAYEAVHSGGIPGGLLLILQVKFSIGGEERFICFFRRYSL
jgi:hypothetical protein